ncbi:MAG: hypothetical protein NC344_08650 [Bacteroidales bacterium]|nr:hypothetical protein [Bacteroidales bacterium]MCM1147879.1 hypothetical protein [Bacteroidales bacterium]MCM1206722.1 hypothetical protein [Bacillota bacterium]MCM1510918.1 hypothetical protein [Clostridium sp.]
MEEIFDIDGFAALREYLDSRDAEEIREKLFAEFLRYARYGNAGEWNRAVRLCECLAIVGWGSHEPLEAINAAWFNGNPNTFFVNRNGKPRFLDAVWTKRKEGIAIDFVVSSFHESPDAPGMKRKKAFTDRGIGEIQDVKLCDQRNWIPKNPVCITRGLANCYDGSKPLIESMENELKPALDRLMRPEQYGTAVNRIILNCSFSYNDNDHCKCNHIIADEALKLKKKDFYPTLLTMFSEKEIEANGYYLRNRFSYGPFRRDTGIMRVGIVLEKEFSDLPCKEQKHLLCGYFLHAIHRIEKRLRHKVTYNFSLMTEDFHSVLDAWCEEKL